MQGEDPDFKVLVAVDQLYGADPALVLAEVQKIIDADPALTSQKTDDPKKIEYQENTEDGSVVGWTTWIDKEWHVSVGCQSRHQSSAVHNANCRAIKESLEIN